MLKNKVKENGTWLAVVILMIISTILYKQTFLSYNNISNVLRQSSMIGLISIGMTCVIITGGIDLSVGSIVALSAVAAAALTEINLFGAIVVPVCMGVSIGAINGFVIVKMKIVPFIATLAVQMGVRGIAYILTNVKSVSVAENAETFLAIGRGYFLGIPIPVIIFAVIAGVMIVICAKTSFGRSLYAIGGNEMAARMMGIKVDRNKTIAYVLTGAFSGLSGMILCSRLGAGQPVAGTGWEMDAVSAVAIGGTLLSGGVGGIGKTISGVVVMGIIGNIINLQGNVNTYVQKIINGVIVLIVIIIQRRTQRKEKAYDNY